MEDHMRKLVAAVMIALIAAPPAFAARNVSDAGQKKDRRICKPVQETGSRMGNIRACMTKAQWREHYRANRWEQANGEIMLRDAVLPLR
jgi:hypothetical protein